jgi:hypothetical protein
VGIFVDRDVDSKEASCGEGRGTSTLTRRFHADVVRRVALVAIRAPYLYHFAAAKQSTTRVARIKKAMPAIFEGRGFLERR